MPLILVLLFIIVPLLEILVIIQVGQVIGVAWTIVALLVNSLLGAWLLRREGRRAWSQFRAALAAGRWPGDEVAQGALIIVGGALLLTPGFLTDVIGFLCLLPPTRALGSRAIRARITAGVVGPFGAAGGPGASDGGRADGADDGRVIGEVEVLEVRREDPPDPADEDAPRD